MTRLILAILTLVTLGACSTYTPQRYSLSADTNVALKQVGATDVGVGPFTGPPEFSAFCRGAGPIAPPDGIGFAAYIQKALADELKVAGMYNEKAPKTTLTGTLDSLSFSSSRGFTGGTWDIGLTLSSSNGKSMAASEHYEFSSGFGAETACKQTAEGYMPAVQNLIAKIVRDPQFKDLVTEKGPAISLK
jgi:hypothetical protein